MEANSPRQGGGRVWLSIRKRGFPERNVFVRSARNRDELNEEHGKILVSEEEGSQYPYEQHFHDVSGLITDVKVRKTWIKKKDGTTVPNDNIEVYMTSGGTELVVNMSFDSLRGKSFAKKFRNIDLSRKVTLDIIDFTNSKGEKIEGLKVLNHYGEEKDPVDAYYGEHNLAQPVEEEQRDGTYKLSYVKTNNDLFRKLLDDIMFEFKHGAETDNVHPSEKAPPPATNAYNRDNHRDTQRSDDRRSEPAREERRDERRDDRRSEPAREERRDERRDDRRDDRREETSRQSDRREPAREERRDERRDDRGDDRRERTDDRRREEPRDDRRGTPREEYSDPVIDTRERETRTRTSSGAPDSNYNPSITRDRVNDKPADSAGKYDDVPF